MVQIPILNGIFTDNGPDFRTSYPVNLVPCQRQTVSAKVFCVLLMALFLMERWPRLRSRRYQLEWRLLSCDGFEVLSALLPMEQSLSSLTLGTMVIDDVNGLFSLTFWLSPQITTYFIMTEQTSLQVTDPDLGMVIDVVWVDGYFMTTDGEFLVVTELNNPFAVNPLKYGSAEADPDPITGLLKLRNEVYALNRNTIEVFDNVGGNLFPFQRIEGAQIEKGSVGTHACCIYIETCAFLGSGWNEAPGVYLGVNANTTKISTQEIDQILLNYTEAELALVNMEARNDRAHDHFFISTFLIGHLYLMELRQKN
jgi:hypothetical protein